MSSSPGSVGLARAHPLTKNPGYGAFPPDLVQLRSTLPVGALVLEVTWLIARAYENYFVC